MLPEPARSIVSLSPSSSEVLATYGASHFMMGRTESCNYPSFVRQLPVVMSGTKPDYEKITKILTRPGKPPRKPDLFVYDPSLFNDADVAKMAENSRMKPFALGGDTIDEFIKELKALSNLYTGETFMSEYVDKITSARGAAKADPLTPTPKVAIIMPGLGSEHMIAGKDSFYADELRAATAEAVGPAGNKFVTLNAESLIQMNPDVIVTAGDSSSFVDDPRFKNLTAVKNNHVINADQDVMVRHGARVGTVITKLHDTIGGMLHKAATN